MNQQDAIERIEALRMDGDTTFNAAADLCVHDIQAYGCRDWLMWDMHDITSMFSEKTDDAVEELILTINSKQAGQVLIDEMLGAEQDRFDVLEESKKLAMASAQMFKVMLKYLSIHEYMKLFMHE